MGRSVADDLARARVDFAEFHAHPELAFHERKTAALFASRLRALGLLVTTGVGGTGVVGVLRNGEGPTLMLRAELDALSIDGKRMHACGHDAHLAIVLASARILSETRKTWSGTLMILGQPAEENLLGARAIVGDAKFMRLPHPTDVIALHTRFNLESDGIAFVDGPLNAYADDVELVFHGDGGHVSSAGASAVAAAADFAHSLKDVSSAGMQLRVGAIQGGSTFNVRAADASVIVSLRAFTSEDRQKGLGFLAKLGATAASENKLASTPKPEIKASSAPITNSPELTARLLPALQKAAPGHVTRESRRTLGADDFSEYAKIPNARLFYFFLGSSSPRWPKPWAQNHGPDFKVDFDEAFKTGTRALAEGARAVLK